MSMGDVVIGGFEIVTPDQIDSVHAHYRSELEDQGFEVSSGSSGSIKASNSRTKRRVDVELSEINSGTLIVVSFSRGR